MAGNVSGLHQFADDVGPEPLKLLDDCYTALTIALNTLSTYSNFYADTGTTNAYTVHTTQYQFASLTDGLQISVRIANTNTGASTLNLNGLGAMPILNQNGAPMEPGQLLAGTILNFTYNAARNAWQIGAGSAGGVLTEPFSVSSPGGQKLLWADSTGTGAAAPFSVIDPDGAGMYYNGTAGLNLSHGPPGSRTLDIFGAVNANPMVAQIHGGDNTAPGSWILWVGATDDVCQPGMSNGLYVMAGTNASDFCMQVTPLTAAGTANAPLYDLNPGNAFFIRGDRTGGIGPAPNQLVWDDAGHFTLTGTATLPMPPLVDLPGITITNPQQGDVLSYNSGTNQWVNAPPVSQLAHLTDVALTALSQGQALIYNVATQKWVNGLPILLLEQLANTNVSGPVAGQVLTYSLNPAPGWINATIPAYHFLTTVSTSAPAAGDVLTWNGSAWIGAPPGQVATFPLTALTDVNIQTPLNRQVLTWDAATSRWINLPPPSPSLATLSDVTLTSQVQGQVLAWDGTLNRWVNSSLPGGSVIALGTLQDVNISNPQNDQVLTWNYADARWENKTPAIAPIISNPAAGQVISYNGTSWVNSAPTLAGLSDVALGTLSDDVLLTYDLATNKWNAGGNAVINGVPGNAGLTINSAGGITVAGPAATGLTALTIGQGGQTAWLLYNPASSGDLRLQNTTLPTGVVVDFAPQGYVTFGPPMGNFSTMLVNGAVNTTTRVYDFKLLSNPSSPAGCSWGMYIKSGSNNTDAPLLIDTLAGQSVFYVTGTGGTVATAASPGTNALQVYGNQGANACEIYSGVQTNASGNFCMAINANAGTPVGLRSGVWVTAGSNINDVCMAWSQVGGGYMAMLRGDGSGWFGGIPGGTASVLCYSDARVAFGNVPHFPGAAGNLALDINNKMVYGDTSARRFKTNINDVGRQRARDIVRRLRAITFNWLSEYDPKQRENFGLIAEEVAEVEPAFVTYDKEGKPIAVQYARVFLTLLPLMQELLEERGYG